MSYSSSVICDDPITTVTIGGQDYYTPFSYLTKLDFVDGYLVNVSSSSFYLNSSFGVSGTSNRVTPYIYCPASQACRYYSSYSGFTLVTSDYSYSGSLEYSLRHNSYYLSVIVVLALFFILITRGHSR